MKAIRWASDRVGEEGIVAFVTNNSFLDGMAFDGMRKHLNQRFRCDLHFNLGGDVPRNFPGRTHNVFGIAESVVSINFFVKNVTNQRPKFSTVLMDWATRRNQETLIDSNEAFDNRKVERVNTDAQYTWLTEGLHAEFEDFIPMGTQEAKEAKVETERRDFSTYSNGVKTNR